MTRSCTSPWAWCVLKFITLYAQFHFLRGIIIVAVVIIICTREKRRNFRYFTAFHIIVRDAPKLCLNFPCYQPHLVYHGIVFEHDWNKWIVSMAEKFKEASDYWLSRCRNPKPLAELHTTLSDGHKSRRWVQWWREHKACSHDWAARRRASMPTVRRGRIMQTLPSSWRWPSPRLYPD